MFVCVAVCSIYTLNRHRRHSCYKDKRRQVGDGDCCKAVMAVIVLKTRTAFICSPSSQRRERKRGGWGGIKERESTQTACGSLSTSQWLHTLVSLSSLSICSSAFFSSSSYSRSPLVPSGQKHQHVTHMAMKHNEHTHTERHTPTKLMNTSGRLCSRAMVLGSRGTSHAKRKGSVFAYTHTHTRSRTWPPSRPYCHFLTPSLIHVREH